MSKLCIQVDVIIGKDIIFKTFIMVYREIYNYVCMYVCIAVNTVYMNSFVVYTVS